MLDACFIDNITLSCCIMAILNADLYDIEKNFFS